VRRDLKPKRARHIAQRRDQLLVARAVVALPCPPPLQEPLELLEVVEPDAVEVGPCGLPEQVVDGDPRVPLAGEPLGARELLQGLLAAFFVFVCVE